MSACASSCRLGLKRHRQLFEFQIWFQFLHRTVFHGAKYVEEDFGGGSFCSSAGVSESRLVLFFWHLGVDDGWVRVSEV